MYSVGLQSYNKCIGDICNENLNTRKDRWWFHDQTELTLNQRFAAGIRPVSLRPAMRAMFQRGHQEFYDRVNGWLVKSPCCVLDPKYDTYQSMPFVRPPVAVERWFSNF